jgi:hypothetical protein
MENRTLAVKIVLAALAAAGLLSAAPAFSQDTGQGQAIVTVMPKHDGEAAPNLTQQDIITAKANGKSVKVSSFASLKGPQNPIELVLLIDDSARSSLGRQMQEIEQFVRSLPPNVKVGIAYMENGRAVFSGPLTADRQQALSALHLPSGAAGVDSSPYFCLSDLAKRWPTQASGARHEVVMVTDGVDNYQRRFDPDDPYVQAAITDSVRAGLVVFSIYWQNQGRFDSTAYASNSGQSLLTEVTEATGGRNFWQGIGNPVSFQPYFDELKRRLDNQYELAFTAPVNRKPEVETFRLKLMAPGAEVDSPEQVLVVPAGAALK